MDTRTNGFDGAAGRMVGPVMARMNRDMERAAVEELAPGPDASVLAVGFGPGVGIAELLPRLPHGVVGGVDPSATMVQQARRRNAGAIEHGQVLLERGTADSIPWPTSTFTGVVAVNSLQLWEPLDASVREVVRVLAPGGRLVTVTHVWAIVKRSPPRAFRRDRAPHRSPDRRGSHRRDAPHRLVPLGRRARPTGAKAPSLQPDRTRTAARRTVISTHGGSCWGIDTRRARP